MRQSLGAKGCRQMEMPRVTGTIGFSPAQSGNVSFGKSEEQCRMAGADGELGGFSTHGAEHLKQRIAANCLFFHA